jgi:hypothetical protein
MILLYLNFLNNMTIYSPHDIMCIVKCNKIKFWLYNILSEIEIILIQNLNGQDFHLGMF